MFTYGHCKTLQIEIYAPEAAIHFELDKNANRDDMIVWADANELSRYTHFPQTDTTQDWPTRNQGIDELLLAASTEVTTPPSPCRPICMPKATCIAYDGIPIIIIEKDEAIVARMIERGALFIPLHTKQRYCALMQSTVGLPYNPPTPVSNYHLPRSERVRAAVKHYRNTPPNRVVCSA